MVLDHSVSSTAEPARYWSLEGRKELARRHMCFHKPVNHPHSRGLVFMFYILAMVNTAQVFTAEYLLLPYYAFLPLLLQYIEADHTRRKSTDAQSNNVQMF